MPAASSQKGGRHIPTKAEGVYKSISPRTGKATWEARYRDSDGKYVYEVCPTFEQAKARRAEMIHRVNKGEVVANPTVTLNDLLDGWRGWRKVKPRTEQSQDSNIKLHIAPKFGNAKVKDITVADLRVWLNTMKRKDGEPMSEGTKTVILAALSSILDYAVDAQVVSGNVCRTLARRSPGSAPSRLASSETANSTHCLRPVIRSRGFGTSSS